MPTRLPIIFIKMVLIFSINSDYSTNEVIRWLLKRKIKIIRINENDQIIIKRLSNSNAVLSLDGEEFTLSDIDSIWYRRGDLFMKTLFSSKSIVQEYNKQETDEIRSYFHTLIENKRNLNNRNFSTVNKLEVLKYCKDNGLNKAPFIITQCKDELLKFFLDNDKKIISKAINTPYILMSNGITYMSYTYKVDDNFIKNLNSTFTPTFFQQQIKKKYEIRTVYLNEKFYSMIIFSQKNKKTAIDFRHYDMDKPNRLSPFKLPNWFQKKMLKMLKEFGINCASFDTIISGKNEYFMIDLNPIGQFGMVSQPCNYNLEEKFAKFLI